MAWVSPLGSPLGSGRRENPFGYRRVSLGWGICFLLVRPLWDRHRLPTMSDQMEAIIRDIEAKRDNFVRRCNAAIEALRGSGAPAAGLRKHRFEANVAPRPTGGAVHGGRRAGSRSIKDGRWGKSKAANGSSGLGSTKSVKDIIREAVCSQTQPFTLQNVRDYVKERYPAAAGKIVSGRYSKELYHLRVTERLFEISSRGEKGGAHVYKLRAA